MRTRRIVMVWVCWGGVDEEDEEEDDVDEEEEELEACFLFLMRQ